MKTLLIAIFTFIPMMGMAQKNVWEIPDQPQQQEKTKVVEKKKAPKVHLQ